MYKKFILQLFLCNMMLVTGWLCVKETQLARLSATPAFKTSLSQSCQVPQVDRVFGIPRRAASGQRMQDAAQVAYEDGRLARENYLAILAERKGKEAANG